MRVGERHIDSRDPERVREKRQVGKRVLTRQTDVHCERVTECQTDGDRKREKQRQIE